MPPSSCVRWPICDDVAVCGAFRPSLLPMTTFDDPLSHPVLAVLLSRRSLGVKHLVEPGPDDAALGEEDAHERTFLLSTQEPTCGVSLQPSRTFHVIGSSSDRAICAGFAAIA